MLLWVLSVVLLYRYEFLKKYPVIKILFLCIFLASSIELSGGETATQGASISILIFMFMFLTIIYLAFKEELDKILFFEKRAVSKTMTSLQEKEALQARIERDTQRIILLEKQLQESVPKNPCDLTQYKLTKTELKIIKLLVTTRETNNYIAEVLQVKEGTIKQHFKNIYDKIGIDDRHDLIELCEHNFTDCNGSSLI